MKILQINKYYYVRSGSERYMFDLSSELERRGHQIVPFAMQHEKNMPTQYSRYFVENIDYDKMMKQNISKRLYAGVKSVYSIEARNKLSRLVRKENPHIAHIHKISNTLTPSILYTLKKKDIPVLQTLHDYRVVCPNYNMYNPNTSQVCEACKGHRYFNALRLKCQKSSYVVGLNIAVESYLYHILKTYDKMIDLFVSPSSFLKKKVVEFGVDEEKIVHIPHFVLAGRYTPNYSNSDYILYFGRLEKHKGVKTLIEAFNSIRDAKLCIAGDGSFRTESENYAKKKGMANVAFLGYVSESRLISLLRDSLFIVVPSEWYENFGFTILESFASGKPVIGADIGGIPELVKDGYTGTLFRPGDVEDLSQKISYLLENKRLISEMGKNAREIVEKEYNADLHCERLMEAYQKIIR